MNLGELLWLALMGGVLMWGYFYLTRFGKQPTQPHTSNGTYADCRHEWGWIEHFISDDCCAVNGRLRCTKFNGHEGQHYTPFPQDTGEKPLAR